MNFYMPVIPGKNELKEQADMRRTVMRICERNWNDYHFRGRRPWSVFYGVPAPWALLAAVLAVLAAVLVLVF